MSLRAQGIRQAIRTAVLLTAASTVALANQPAVVAPAATPLCYCHCDHQPDQKPCTSMCDLTQYEGRWWANSCHKKPARSLRALPNEEPESQGAKTNRTERAAL